ncbi:beta-ketoacyl synthase N-terminal-like domain-containing protein [Kitasatospora sp. A2-31]|uniref:beta-ketoacyl synthase N-terminal-like domain-containing protein n=1 Tax=Kitasatospora sp. A2-31 TaxID=2916414 RepID=UPI001EEB89A5|nr:beta-ketoacyl synthase N-terminal-like domain-containing protein [Kitasatospora sp. A2-31]MCG6495255.1 3-oxoacyl-ACP synthase [Kitasatospora sp. A2-31]
MSASTAIRPVITGWSAISPYGLDAEALAEGLRSGRSTATTVDTTRWQVPEGNAHLVPGFEVREVLGKKGTRSMDRVTGLAISAVRGLLVQPEADPQRETGDRAALVLGTTTGSVASMMDFTRSSLEGTRPFEVDPALMPNAVMNCAAGQSAIWHGLRGPNTTVAGGRTASLAALNYATRLLASGRADSVLCGAVEEFSAARYWIEHHSRGTGAPATDIGEGSAMLLIQPSDAVSPGRRALAEVLAVRSRVAARVDDHDLMASCVNSALEAAGVAPHEVWAAVPSDAPGAAGLTEVAALRAVLGAQADEALTRVPAVGVLGDVSAATGVFQIAILLSSAAEQPAAAGRPVVLTSVDRDGALACAVLRLGAE